MQAALWYLLAGTRGGPMRARILMALRRRPANAHQLAKALNVDYTTVQHHLEILLENRVLVIHGKYGAIYLLSPEMEGCWKEFAEIWERIGKESGKHS